MRHSLLCDELDDITHSYDYGIVPGSATVFVRDELNNIGRLDLTLLEGVMIVVEVSKEGYKVASCSPLSNSGVALATAKIVQKNLEVAFETMDNLLMAVSPMFRERFQQALYDKLESVHRHQQGPTSTNATHKDSSNILNELSQLVSASGSKTLPISTSIASTSLVSPSIADSLQPEQQASSILLHNSLLQQNQHQQQTNNQQQQMDLDLDLDLDQALSQEVLDDLQKWIH